MTDPVLSVIAALWITSLLVRILPVFLGRSLPTNLTHRVETCLPAAVFLNLIVYLVFQETRIAMIPAFVALALTAVMACASRGGLMAGVLCASSIYYVLSLFC